MKLWILLDLTLASFLLVTLVVKVDLAGALKLLHLDFVLLLTILLNLAELWPVKVVKASNELFKVG